GDGDLTPSCFHKLPSDPEANAGPEVTFGREKRLENSFHVLLLDPRAAVADYSLNAVSGGSSKRSRGYVEYSSLKHRIERVRNHVREDLKHFALADNDLLEIVKARVHGDS